MMGDYITPAISSKKDWTGTMVGESTVLGKVGERIYTKGNRVWRVALWKVECSCGDTREVAYTDVTSGRINRCKSCALKLNSGRTHYKWQGGKYIPLSFLTQVQAKLVRPSKTIECNLTIKDLDDLWERQQGKCAYTGMALEIDKGWGGKQTLSLDRIDSSKGYTLENVQFVHKEINIMKQAMTDARFVELCKMVAKERT